MIGAATTSRDPLIGFKTASISLQTPSMISRSGPNTLTPMSVRTPVESISIRLIIGWVKMLLQPGTCNDRPISSSTKSPFGPVCRCHKKTSFLNDLVISFRNATKGEFASENKVTADGTDCGWSCDDTEASANAMDSAEWEASFSSPERCAAQIISSSE